MVMWLLISFGLVVALALGIAAFVLAMQEHLAKSKAAPTTVSGAYKFSQNDSVTGNLPTVHITNGEFVHDGKTWTITRNGGSATITEPGKTPAPGQATSNTFAFSSDPNTSVGNVMLFKM